MSHHVDDIRTALETSPAVREAVAAMLAALGKAWRMDKGQEHDTLEIEFSNQREVTDCMEQIAAASKAVDKWIMESRDDDMDANGQTVAVQKAIGAIHALLGIANGAEWRAYQQLETDTRRSVTERMAQTILDALQQPPAAPPPADSEDSQLAAIARGIAEGIEVYNLPISGDTHFSFIHGSTRYVGDLHAPHPAPLMEALRQLALWKAGQQVAGAGEAAPVDTLAKEGERIAELEAEVARLQRERDSAVRDADKRALLLREIEFYTDPKRRLDGQALSDKLDSIHARIVYVTASLSVPESEATDGA